MNELIDTTKPVREGEELDADALRAYLLRALPADLGIGPGIGADAQLHIEQFPSGYSNLTYGLRLGQVELVLRRPPFAVQVKSGHDMGREYKVLSGLAPVYPPAPRPFVYCEDPGVIGTPFYVMERRRGVILRRSLPEPWAGDPDLFRRMCHTLVDNLADLHAVDVKAAGLSDLGKPQGYVRRQVEGWIARWEKAKTSEVPEMDELGKWLRDRMPAESAATGATLVHNDYKFDNVMLAAEDPTRVVAVLDWELCTQGDPLMDLGTTLGYWVEPDDDPVWKATAFSPSLSPGAPSRRELADRYAERTGRDTSNMLYYYCFALLKIGVIVQQIFYRYHHGHTKDPRFAKLDQAVQALARGGAKAAETQRY